MSTQNSSPVTHDACEDYTLPGQQPELGAVLLPLLNQT
eukprot:COSAG05_NODE_6335_length_978_cov_1.180887_1_plen_37_part_10